jgi:hypothetical protein
MVLVINDYTIPFSGSSKRIEKEGLRGIIGLKLLLISL